MNEDPRGTVRRSAEGALLVREFRGDELGWKLVPAESEDCVFLGDRDIDPLWLQWPIIWCPDSTFHEQDNIRRAQGLTPMSIVQVSVLPGLTMAAAPMDELLDERLAHRGGAGEDAAVDTDWAPPTRDRKRARRFG